jgi:3-phenylpropionate/trans-cinnamate dioxygenase ferredoxin subunit
MICLARTKEGEVFAVDDACTHEGYSLGDDGELDGDEVECSMHGSTFDLRTGAVTGPPARIATRTYSVELDGQRIYIEV